MPRIFQISSPTLRIQGSFTLPDVQHQNHCADWAPVLLEQDSWLDPDLSVQLSPLKEDERMFVGSFLQTARLFLELVNLPAFMLPRLVAMSPDRQNGRMFRFEIELPLVEFVQEKVFQVATETALKICLWLTQSPPSPENRRILFSTLEKKLIGPLQGTVAAGKSTIPVLKVAHALGIPFLHLGAGAYQLGWGSKARRLDRSAIELDSSIGARLSHNKAVASQLLRDAGLPAPLHRMVQTEAEALGAARQLGFPVVIKPTDRDRGEGVSVDVADEAAVRQAFAHAHRLSRSHHVLVERQVDGVCHRLFMANGRLLYAVKRLPMSVQGDGRHTVAELVQHQVEAQERRPPWNRSGIQPIDERAVQALAQVGLSPASIPAEGRWAPLRRIESTADGGVDEDVTHSVHPDNLSVAIQAASLFGLHVAGIDIISPDISRPWHENGAIINEVNFAPLLGGGEISRSRIPAFLAEFIEGDGRIPIAWFDSEAAALDFQQSWRAQGKRCYRVGPDDTVDGAGRPLPMPLQSLAQRVRALTLRAEVDAIAVVGPVRQGRE